MSSELWDDSAAESGQLTVTRTSSLVGQRPPSTVSPSARCQAEEAALVDESPADFPDQQRTPRGHQRESGANVMGTIVAGMSMALDESPPDHETKSSTCSPGSTGLERH